MRAGNLDTRKIRHVRVRKRVTGSQERPRLCVFRSNKHIYAQVILDTEGRTVASASTLDPELRDLVSGGNKDAARKVGELVARRAMERGVDKVVFDRGGYIYHGRIAAVAEGARAGGLKF